MKIDSGYWPALGAAIGMCIGLVDLVIMVSLGVTITFNGVDAALAVGLVFAFNTGLLGWALGRSQRSRQEARSAQAALVTLETLAAIGRLSASVAHEVRNPLGVIRASARHISEELSDGPASRACGFIEEEVDRLDRFIGALLDYARPLQLDRTPTAPATVTDRALGLAREHLEGVELVTTDLGFRSNASLVSVDEDKLSRVVAGLLINATQTLRDAPDDPKIANRIELRTGWDAGGFAVEVADGGPGIEVDAASRVFEPFYTTRANGTGLGLAMAARIVAAHDGQLAVVFNSGAGPAGRGACFRLTVPAVNP